MKDPSLTLGIEEEYQVVDPESGELSSYITQILDAEGQITVEGVKPELHQSVIEVGSGVCETPAEIRSEVVRLRRAVADLAASDGLRILAAGTHPFSSWMDQEITPLERYLGVEQDLQDLARKNLIFGMHVHVGIEDKEFLIDAMKVARYFIPHLLALSTSSPFWMGRRTGLKSYRSVQWRNFPRTGIPPTFNTYSEYEHIVRALVNADAIQDPSKIWWDLRPHHLYPTLEFRLCDICTRVEEAVCIAALIQAIVAKLWRLRRDNMTFRVYPLSLIEENKWRAVRYGVSGDLLDLGRERPRPAKELIEELIGWFLDDVLDDLGTRREVEYAYTILEHGTSADRQIETFEETGELKSVVDRLVGETYEGLPESG
ncbi:MAG: carboxylate-amine ligase [Gemmatimonadetes bacterium]|nr:carboxylate-amine ligase [Gemmatimonadota bacterium]NNF14734.1 carboxylate-amine ligase [Gemmatimonadota bacterium]NNL31464.1 carboxylate-amine ligase [Gemmatimonadota bacterium]